MEFIDNKRKLVEYLKKNLAKGYTIESLKIALLNQGYARPLIERVIEETNKELAKSAPVLKEKPVIRYELIDENDKPVIIKKSWLKKIFG
ncbi:MAG: hypothetical protein ABIA78_03130 [archaeon]